MMSANKPALSTSLTGSPGLIHQYVVCQEKWSTPPETPFRKAFENWNGWNGLASAERVIALGRDSSAGIDQHLKQDLAQTFSCSVEFLCGLTSRLKSFFSFIKATRKGVSAPKEH